MDRNKVEKMMQAIGFLTACASAFPSEDDDSERDKILYEVFDISGDFQGYFQADIIVKGNRFGYRKPARYNQLIIWKDTLKEVFSLIPSNCSCIATKFGTKFEANHPCFNEDHSNEDHSNEDHIIRSIN